jgi:hypothetical protein
MLTLRLFASKRPRVEGQRLLGNVFLGRWGMAHARAHTRDMKSGQTHKEIMMQHQCPAY